MSAASAGRPDEGGEEGREGEDRSGGDAARHPVDESLPTGELPEAAPCPHCGGTDTEQQAAFGSAVSVSQYWCRSCRTVFEFFKWR